MFIPPEILCIIASHLPTSSIPEFRRTNKNFSIAGLPYLIPSLSIKLLPQSISRFIKISQHPVFSRYITEVVLIKDIVADCRTIAEWQDHIHRSRPWPKRPKDDDPEELHAAYTESLEKTWGTINDYRFPSGDAHIGWQCQKDVRNQQETLMRPNLPELSQCFAAALPRLPRLRTVRLAGCIDGVDSLGHERLDPIYQKRYKYSESLSIEGLQLGADQLRSMLMSINTHMATKIEHLSAYELHVDFFDPQNNNFQSMCDGACSLQSLDIDFSVFQNTVYGNWYGRNYVEYHRLFESEGIKLFLKALPNLRHLRLCFGSINGLRECPKFEHVLGGVKITSLQNLDICTIQTRSKEFVQFFSDHAMYMKRVRIKDVCLIDEEPSTCWSDVLNAIRDEIKLEAIDFRGTLESLFPRTQIDMRQSIPRHPNMTVNELLTGFLVDKDQTDISGRGIQTDLEEKSSQKLDRASLKMLIVPVKVFL